MQMTSVMLKILCGADLEGPLDFCYYRECEASMEDLCDLKSTIDSRMPLVVPW